MSWFPNIDDITYEAVEYIPYIGKVYLFRRTGLLQDYADKKRFWESTVNFTEGVVRDAVLVPKTGKSVRIVLVHPMLGPLSEALTAIFLSNGPVEISVKNDLPSYNPDVEELVLMAGKDKESAIDAAQLFFRGAAKGVHYFYDSYFTGRIVHPRWAPRGEMLVLHFPEGIRAGARWLVVWRWTTDAAGAKNRPEYSYGHLRVSPGNPVTFGFPGSGWRGYYDFWGSVNNLNHIELKTREGDIIQIALTRMQKPSALGA